MCPDSSIRQVRQATRATQAQQAPPQQTIETYIVAFRIFDPRPETDMQPIALRCSTPASEDTTASERVGGQLQSTRSLSRKRGTAVRSV